MLQKMIWNDFKTPFFLIDKEKIDAGLEELQQALLCSWGNYSIGYSFKTNALPWVIRHFIDRGCYAEVVSDDEYALALSVPVEKNKLIYNGVAKSKETFLEAVRNHAIVNIDAEYEIDWLDALNGRGYEVGIRANFDLQSKCPGQTQCGEEGERFGFCYENGELRRAVERIQSKGVKVSGIHLHKSSKTRMPNIYQAIAEAAVEISRDLQLDLTYVDIGGGFFGGLETKPRFAEYFDIVSAILKRHFDPLRVTLIVEPGMALIGAAVDYVSTVLDVKKTTRSLFVVTDGSRTQIDPLMTKQAYFSKIERKGHGRRIVEKQIISGFTCMEHDRLFAVANEEEIFPGDLVIYHKVGAYTMCLSPLFIKWFPDVYVLEKGVPVKVRNRWKTEDYRSGCDLT